MSLKNHLRNCARARPPAVLAAQSSTAALGVVSLYLTPMMDPDPPSVPSCLNCTPRLVRVELVLLVVSPQEVSARRSALFSTIRMNSVVGAPKLPSVECPCQRSGSMIPPAKLIYVGAMSRDGRSRLQRRHGAPREQLLNETRGCDRWAPVASKR